MDYLVGKTEVTNKAIMESLYYTLDKPLDVKKLIEKIDTLMNVHKNKYNSKDLILCISIKKVSDTQDLNVTRIEEKSV